MTFSFTTRSILIVFGVETYCTANYCCGGICCGLCTGGFRIVGDIADFVDSDSAVRLPGMFLTGTVQVGSLFFIGLIHWPGWLVVL